MRVSRHRWAFTLIEIVICLALGSLLLLCLSQLFSGGVRTSVKGVSHLTNMHLAALLMRQIELDVSRSVAINVDGQEQSLTLDVVCGVTHGAVKTEKITYWPFRDKTGFVRQRLSDGDTGHQFCRGLTIEPVPGSPVFTPIHQTPPRLGVQVRFRVTGANRAETLDVQRLFVSLNAPENQTVVGWQQ